MVYIWKIYYSISMYFTFMNIYDTHIYSGELQLVVFLYYDFPNFELWCYEFVIYFHKHKLQKLLYTYTQTESYIVDIFCAKFS